ncbi:hypothetical protein D1872_78250 [compost metagenome]
MEVFSTLIKKNPWAPSLVLFRPPCHTLHTKKVTLGIRLMSFSNDTLGRKWRFLALQRHLLPYKIKRHPRAPFLDLYICLYVFRLNQAVATVFAAVHNVHFFRLRIAEYEEIMPQHIHL